MKADPREIAWDAAREIKQRFIVLVDDGERRRRVEEIQLADALRPFIQRAMEEGR